VYSNRAPATQNGKNCDVFFLLLLLVTYSTAVVIFVYVFTQVFDVSVFVVVVIVEKKRFVRLIVVFWKEVAFFGTSRANIWAAACFKCLLLLFFVYFIYRSHWIGGIFVVVAIRVIVKFEFSTFATKRNSRIDPNRRQMKVFVLRAKDLLRW